MPFTPTQFKPLTLPTHLATILLLAIFTLLTPQSKADGLLCSNRSVISTFQTDFPAINICIIDSIVYVASGQNGLNIIDISNPSNMKLLGSYDTMEWVNSVFVVDGIAYLANNFAGLIIIDVADPEHPVKLAEFKHDAEVLYKHVVVQGPIAYVADHFDGLIIVDISNPKNPAQLGSYNNRGQANHVEISNDIVYLSDGDRGLQLIDVSNPISPTLSSFLPIRGLNCSITNGRRRSLCSR